MFVYPTSTLGQQNGHFLCICVFVCVWEAGSSSYPFPGDLTGSLSHAMWEEVSPSIIDCADRLEKPLPAHAHTQTQTQKQAHANACTWAHVHKCTFCEIHVERAEVRKTKPHL